MYSSLLLATSLFTTILASTNEYVTSQDFHEFLTLNDKHIVLFTSRSLPTIQSYTTIFKRANHSTSTRFMTIDCDEETELCDEYDINSYPTIRLFDFTENEDGETMHMSRYRGPRTEKAIQGFVKRGELPIVTEINPEDMEHFKHMDDTVIIGYLPPDSPSLLEAFTSVAQQHHSSYVFGYTTNPTVASKEQATIPSIIVLKNVDNDHRILNGVFTHSSLSSFLETAIPNVIRDFSEKDLERFMQRDKLTVYIFTGTEDEGARMRKDLTPVAKKYEKYATFAIADAVKHAEMATNFMLRFGVQGKLTAATKTPSVVVHAPLNDNVFMYALGKTIDHAAVEGMLVTILQGKAKSGDVFGREAADVEDVDEGKAGHDEL